MRVADLIAAADVAASATHVMCHAYDGYSTNLPLVEAVKPDVLLVHQVDGAPLPRGHGGPVRMITPPLYSCAHPLHASTTCRRRAYYPHGLTAKRR